MMSWKRLGSMLLIAGVLSAQQDVQDPVVKAKKQRAASADGDLPPVPRAILEPPSLPPSETHVKDTAGWKAAKDVRKTRGTTPKKAVKGAPVASRARKAVPRKVVPRKKKRP